MAIVDGLCTLADVKARLNIASADTSRNDLLESLINEASACIVSATRSLKRATYTSEKHNGVPSSYIYLKHRPIQSITSVVMAGQTLASGSDSGYYLSSEDQLAGRLYRPLLWETGYLLRGLMGDAYEGTRDIEVTYVAGYYLPADVGYVLGASASLPMKYSMACVALVQWLYNAGQNADIPMITLNEILQRHHICTVEM